MLLDKVLFIDGEAIVIDKPAGLPVDRPRDGSLSLENQLESLAFGFRRWPQAVHRLDRDTSGCLLLSRNPKAHARLHHAFEAGIVEKRYLAVLEGVVEGESGVIDLALTKVSTAETGWRMQGDPKGKPSRTAWRVIEVKAGRSFVEFRPETGRTHQIRVHALEGLGFPLVGDPVYGRGGTKTRTLLHAERLVVKRDVKPSVIVEAPFPDSFIALGFAAPEGAEPTRG